VDKRKATSYSDYKSSLRQDEGVMTFMDLWKDIFGDYLANDEQHNGAGLLTGSSKMIQNRVQMYLYQLFMIYLCRELKIVKESDSLTTVLDSIKRVSKSGKVRDTILNRVYEAFANENTKQTFETRLFGIIDTKVKPLRDLLVDEYLKNDGKIDPERVKAILYS
jgi:hypothetical protein